MITASQHERIKSLNENIAALTNVLANTVQRCYGLDERAAEIVLGDLRGAAARLLDAQRRLEATNANGR